MKALLQHGNTRIRRLAVGIIMSLAVSLKGKSEALQCEGLLQNLCEIVSSKSMDAGVQANARLGLSLISENNEAKAVIAHNLLEHAELLREIIGGLGMAQIAAEMLKHHSSIVQDQALDCLTVLVADEDGRHDVWQRLDIVPNLCHVLMNSKNILSGKATRCMRMLCSSHMQAHAQLTQLVHDDKHIRDALLARPSLEQFVMIGETAS